MSTPSHIRSPDCVFCGILERTEPASFVYEDDRAVAFMDINQPNPGHVLVIPRDHYSSLIDVPSALAGHLFTVAQRIDAALRKTDLRCDGVHLALADGEAAGQEVFHVHLHVQARIQGDFGNLMLDVIRHHAVFPTRGELDRLAELIRLASEQGQ